MIIFGSRPRAKTLSSGTFYCPKCQTNRQYELKKAKNYFTLYFVPLFPIGDIGEFVECQTCHFTFDPGVLKFKSPPIKRDLATMLNSIKADTESGQPVEYIVRDLVAAGLERTVALAAVTSAIGDARRYCATCNLSYVPAVNTCSECNQPLSEAR